MLVFALTILLSAFLLFQVQPLMGKYILPWFGSSAGVWTTALLFFQVLLLAGYAYAHWLQARLTIGRQAVAHMALLAAALAFLPIIPSEAWGTASGADPTTRILLLLGATVGLPYVLLSSTAPLLQRWFSHLYSGRSPYRLYAISNAGSLLALLTYPLLVERFIRLRLQAWTWSVGFALFVALVGLTAWMLWGHVRRLTDGEVADEANGSPPAAHAATSDVDAPHPTGRSILLWLTLSALGSLMLLATLNQMTLDVPAVPLLYVLPLSLYLVTFIIAFDHQRWYVRPLFCVLLPVAIGGAVYAVIENIVLSLPLRIGLYALALFACCMSCHGELVRSKPDPQHLTLFYLMVASGGALGGLFVAVLAPALFDGFWEYPLGLATTYGMIMFLVGRDLVRRSETITPELEAKPKRTAPRRAREAEGRARRQRAQLWRLGRGTQVAGAAGIVALAGALAVVHAARPTRTIARARGFYGVVEVSEAEMESPRVHKYNLMHGHTRHGFQYRLPDKRRWPTTYYGPNSGVGIAIRFHPQRRVPNRQFRVGIVGLGPGTISAYAGDGGRSDYQRYYEINPQVVELAETYFTFLEDARQRGAEVEIVLGDARMEMQRELQRGEAQRFDVLAVDAFSSDAVPMHLLTKECFEVYLAHLEPDGILALHVSSRYLNLLPVVRSAAEALGKRAYYIHYPGDNYGNSASRWMLVTDDPVFLASVPVQQAITPIRPRDRRQVLWTDDFGSLLDAIE